MATFQINNNVFSSSITPPVPKPTGGVVTVFPNTVGVTVYYWQKVNGTWQSTNGLFINGQANSGPLTGDQKAVLGTIQSTASGLYGLTTSNQAPGQTLDGSTGEINVGTGKGGDEDED